MVSIRVFSFMSVVNQPTFCYSFALELYENSVCPRFHNDWSRGKKVWVLEGARLQKMAHAGRQ